MKTSAVESALISLKLEKGEELVAALEGALQEHNLNSAKVLCGNGLLIDSEILSFPSDILADRKKIIALHELVYLQGNIERREDGDFIAHLHGVLALTPGSPETMQALILRGRVESSAEITLWKLQRKYSPREQVLAHLAEVFAEEGAEVGVRLARARVADKEGWRRAGEVLTEIAYDEAKHASWIAEVIHKEDIRDTRSNLLASIEADRYAQKREQDYLQIARETGDAELIRLFEQLVSDEKEHVRRLQAFCQQMGWNESKDSA